MKDWHLEHVEKVIVRYVKGVSPDASSFEKRNYKKYSTVSSCAKQIDKSFKDLQKSPESLQRLDELERQIAAPRKVAASFF
jgi:hypothetical protein